MNKRSIIHAECIGYALEQCYSSCIAIIREHEDCTDEEHLRELKQLVDAYEAAISEVGSSNDLRWNPIDPSLLERVKQAKTRHELYAE